MGRIKGVRKKLSEELGFLVQAVHIRDNLELGPEFLSHHHSRRAGGRVRSVSRPRAGHQSGPGVGHAAGLGHQGSGLRPGCGLDRKVAARAGAGAGLHGGRRQQRDRHPFEPPAAIACARAAGPRGSAAAAQPPGQERAEADRGSGAEAPADERRGQGAAVPAAGARADPQPAHHLRDARRNSRRRLRIPLALVAAVRVALGRSIVQNIGGLREELPVITLDPALEQVLQDSMAGGGEARRASSPDSPTASRQALGRQHAAPGSGRRTRGAAGGAEDPAVDRAPDAPLDAVARGAGLQRNSRKPPHPRDCRGWTMNELLDSWRSDMKIKRYMAASMRAALRWCARSKGPMRSSCPAAASRRASRSSPRWTTTRPCSSMPR